MAGSEWVTTPKQNLPSSSPNLALLSADSDSSNSQLTTKSDCPRVRVTGPSKCLQDRYENTEIGQKAGRFAKLQPGGARMRINAT